VGNAELYAADPGDNQTEYFACIRGESVILEKGRPDQSSARNHLDGRVVDITPMGTLVRVTIDVGFTVVALLTRQGMADLELSKGSAIVAVFKASAVHLIPRNVKI
jgi:molybdopterin-binding protein